MLLGLGPSDCVGKRNVSAGDRGGSGPAIGLKHVAVDDDGVFTQSLDIDNRTQASTD